MFKFKQWLDKTLSVVTAAALIAMMLHIVAHALSRYFFNTPLYGTNELVGFWYLPIVALLGIPAAQLQREQITVTLVVDRMTDKAAGAFKVFACCTGALASVGFAWFGLKKAFEDMAMGSVAGVTDIFTWPVQFLIPLVFGLLALLYVFDLIVLLRGRRAHEVRQINPTDPEIEAPVLRRAGNE